MQIKMYPDWPNLVGRKQAFVGTSNGPTSYVSSTAGVGGGEPVTLTGYNSYIDVLFNGAVSVSGKYILQAFPDGPGPRANWKVRWLVAPSAPTGTGTVWEEVATGTPLSGETVILSGFASGT